MLFYYDVRMVLPILISDNYGLQPLLHLSHLESIRQTPLHVTKSVKFFDSQKHFNLYMDEKPRR